MNNDPGQALLDDLAERLMSASPAWLRTNRSRFTQVSVRGAMPPWLAILKRALAKEDAKARLDRIESQVALLWAGDSAEFSALRREAGLHLSLAGLVLASRDEPLGCLPGIKELVRCSNGNLSVGECLMIAAALDERMAQPPSCETLIAPPQPVLLVEKGCRQGKLAFLCLRLARGDGSGRLLPDLRMRLVEREEDWRGMELQVRQFLAAESIWPMDSQVDIFWSILPSEQDETIPALSGGSAGAAFALGIHQMLASAGGRCRMRLDNLAVSATLDAAGTLGGVSGTREKLIAVLRKNEHRVRAVAFQHDLPVGAPTDRQTLWLPAPLPFVRRFEEIPPDAILREDRTGLDVIQPGQTYSDLILRVEAYNFRWAGNPYVGLSAFSYSDSEIFHGREGVTKKLIRLFEERERDATDQCAFICIEGSSGFGKSSLVRAGLAPALARRAGLPNHSTRPWNFIELVPSRMVGSLTEAVASCLAEHHPEWQDGEQDTWTEGSEPGGNFQDDSLSTPGILLLIDQFEEALCLPEWTADPQRCRELLVDLGRLARSKRFRVVITLRSEYVAEANKLPEFLDLFSSSTGVFSLKPPEREALLAIITRPAQIAGATFEPLVDQPGATLAHTLLADIQAQPEALPLLQFVLQQLYDTSLSEAVDGNIVLSQARYEAMGRLGGAIKTHADRTLRKLKDENPQADWDTLFKAVFSKFAIYQDSIEPNRWARTTVSLEELKEGSCDPRAIGQLVDFFERARLIKVVEFSGTKRHTLTHDSLLESWTALAELLEQQRSHSSILGQIRETYRIYRGNGGGPARQDNPARFLHGDDLQQAERLAAGMPYLFEAGMLAWIKESVGWQKRNRRRKRMVHWAWVGMLLLMLGTGGASYLHSERAKAEGALRVVNDIGAILTNQPAEFRNDQAPGADTPGILSQSDPNSWAPGNRPFNPAILTSGPGRLSLLKSIGMMEPRYPEKLGGVRTYLSSFDGAESQFAISLLAFTEAALAYDAGRRSETIHLIEAAIDSASIAMAKSETPVQRFRASDFRIRIRSRLSDVLMENGGRADQEYAVSLLERCVEDSEAYLDNPLVPPQTVDRKRHYYKLRLSKALAALSKSRNEPISEEAKNLLKDAIKHIRRNVEAFPLATPIETERALANYLLRAGNIALTVLDDPALATELFTAVREVRERILVRPESDSSDRLAAGGDFWHLASAAGNRDQEEKFYREAIKQNQWILDHDQEPLDHRAIAQENIGEYYILLAQLAAMPGRIDLVAARSDYVRATEALASATAIYARCPASETTSRSISGTLLHLGGSLSDYYRLHPEDNEIAPAVAAFEQAIEMSNNLVKAFPGSDESCMKDLVAAHHSLGFLFTLRPSRENSGRAIENFAKVNAVAEAYRARYPHGEVWALGASANALLEIAKLSQRQDFHLLADAVENSNPESYFETALSRYNEALSKESTSNTDWIRDAKRAGLLAFYCGYLKTQPDKAARLGELAKEYFEESNIALKKLKPTGDFLYWWVQAGCTYIDSLRGKPSEALKVSRLLETTCRANEELLGQDPIFQQGFMEALRKVADCVRNDDSSSSKAATVRFQLLNEALSHAQRAWEPMAIDEGGPGLEWHRSRFVSLIDEWNQLSEMTQLGTSERARWTTKREEVVHWRPR